MGEKDIIEKTLESYNDVFADIVNGLIFDGQEIVKEDELIPAEEFSMYKADKKLHQQQRDVSKYWKKGKICLTLLGFENQTVIDKDMPIRVLGYDGAAYRNQLNGKTKERYPVITLVLYFGDNDWKSPKSLLECIDVSDELKPFVSDYRINVFQVCKFSNEQISKFKSDFKIIADYFAHRNNVPGYKGTDNEIKHVDEFFKFMEILTNDNKFENMYNESRKKRGGLKMDEFLSKVEARGEAKGQAEIINKFLETMSIEEIAERLGLPVEKVQEMSKPVSVTA